MVDTTRSKWHLDTTENTLNSLNKIEEINGLINATALNLASVLWGSNHELYIDAETLTKLQNIHTRLDAANLTHDIKQRYDIYDARVTAWWRHADAEDKRKRALYEVHLSDVAAWTSNIITTRHTEYWDILTEAGKFNLGFAGYVPQTVRIDNWSSPATIQLNAFCNSIPPVPTNELCDENWTPLVKRWSNWEVNVGWTTYTLSGIVYNAAAWTYNFTNMKVNPSTIDISKPLVLSVTARYPTHWISVACNRTFQLNLSEWWPANAAARASEIDAYNTSIPGTTIVNDHLQSRFQNEEAQIVRDAIARAVKKIGSPVFDSLSDQQKEEFYNRVMATSTLPNLAFRAGTDGRRELSATLEHWCNYNDFRDWFAHNDRAWNKNQNNTRTQKAYRQYFHDHFKDESRKYFDTVLDDALNDIDNETYLKAEVNRYLVEVEANGRDDDTARSNLEGPLAWNDVRMERRRRWQIRKWFRSRDDNFMRFFSWSSKGIKNQTVQVSTTTPRDPHNLWPIKYGMKINVPENNRIWIEINIEWQEPITLQSWDYDPVTLARRILREPSIPTSKARVHMVYNLYKWLLQLAREKNIKLEYYDSWSGAMREITLAPNWNIVLNSVVYWTTPPYARTSTALFDEQSFQNMNQFDSIWRNNSLEEWILSVARHFSYAMNRMDNIYRRSTKRALWWAVRSSATTGLPTSFWTSPIRKILNKNNTTNFDFSTTVWTTRIELKGNTFTVTTPACPTPLVSKDLGKILHKRVNKKRIFDWVERDIVEAVYSNLIKKMRENSKIARTNFWVVDELTWHVYILDSTWDFWRINRDVLNWANIVHRFWWVKMDAGVISEKTLSGTRRRPWYAYHRLTANEEKELLKNPLLMQGFVKAMNRRMWLVESIRAWFDRH